MLQRRLLPPSTIISTCCSSVRHKRIYTTGLERDATYGPEAVRKRMIERGVKIPVGAAGRAYKVAQDTDPTEVKKDKAPIDQKRADSRFFRKIKDFREIQDDDPYAGLFGERRSFVRTKVGAWREQFERENEDVELPYERTNPVAKQAPNWFVQWLIGIRENQGMDPWWLFASFAICLVFIGLWNNATVQPLGKERDIKELQ